MAESQSATCFQEMNVEDSEDFELLDSPIGPPIFNASDCVLTIANRPQ
jgi:hypothetical protein